ncbi:MAG: hypothetical protein RET84_02890 [Pseudomonadota bacterium]|nr:hypothetical protein [Pseudomonadota bacterium]MDQ8017186.1 hypothetical protein [Pseudomonadota bacterium]
MDIDFEQCRRPLPGSRLGRLLRRATSNLAGAREHGRDAPAHARVRDEVFMHGRFGVQASCGGGRPGRLLAATLAAIAVILGPLPAQAQPQSRGELLYATNCIACHTEQVHWRDRKLVRDWNSLAEQVRRWQEAASLGWRDDDILAVALYLNDRYYGFVPDKGTAALRTLAPASPPRPSTAGCRRTT